jgi:isocitrate lyase
VPLPVERRRAVVGEQLAGEALVDRLRVLACLAEVGTGYFDRVSKVVSGGRASTLALEGSTEEAQFESRVSG